MNRITVTLEPNERDALWLLAKRERRDPRAQAALLIRERLEDLGLLQPIPPSDVDGGTNGPGQTPGRQGTLRG